MVGAATDNHFSDFFTIGDRVKVTFEDRGDGAMVPQFERAAQATS